MHALTLIQRFADAGVRLSADKGRLAFEGPGEVLTPESIEELRRHKSALLAALTGPDLGDFEERAAIIEHDGGSPREEAEARAAQAQGYVDADGLYRAAVRRWAAQIERLARLRADSPECAEALERARAFISGGWALQAARLGWDEVALFGVCPCAPWSRQDSVGVAFGGAVQAITRDAIVYVGGLRRRRETVNSGGGAALAWEATNAAQDD